MIVPRTKEDRAPGGKGFTLLELCLVVVIITAMMSIALPNLLPVLASTEFEGAARHIANFGRAAMATASLSHESLTVRIDLDKQEYWALRWPEPTLGLSKKKKNDPKIEEAKKLADKILDNPGDETLQLEAMKQLEGEGGNQDQLLADAIGDRFERFARRSLEARARNVSRGGILDEIGPLFDKEFSLDDEDKKQEEMKDPLLERTHLPEGITIESVRVGNASHGKGQVDVEVSPTGLYETVRFYIKSQEREYMTVTWDPITGRAHLYDGKQADG